VAADPLSQFRLDGKVAVVTGGSRGMGREMVMAFARVGADVVIASRKLAGCEELAKQVRNETGQRALAVAYHAANWSDSDDLARRSLDEFGRVDVLVNNAGMSPLYDDVCNISEQLWDKVTGVNQKGPFRLSALLGTAMKANGGGSIINISSTAGQSGGATELPYAGAKAALNNMTRSFAKVFAPAVRVNCIMPGAFLTDISNAWSPDILEALQARVLLGRAGEPHEIVGPALFLASDASSYVTGSVFAVDGGMIVSQ
jgi:NAD(P)-dependent dehydrogenase (short-subunit alcohol dehydrogenase family)